MGSYKKTYLAVTETENGKYFAYVLPVTNSDNLLAKLDRGNVLHANICSSRKEAGEIVSEWNNSYRTNGTYALDNGKEVLLNG